MAISDLLPLWLREHRNNRRKLARAAEEAYGLLQVKGTLYACSVKAIADAHNKAADVYEAALKEHEGEQP